MAPFMDVQNHCPPPNIHNSYLDVKAPSWTALFTISKVPPQFPQKYTLHPQPFTPNGRGDTHQRPTEHRGGGRRGEGKLKMVLIQGNNPTKSNHHPPTYPTFTTPSSPRPLI
mmetsp:Transcript_8069/g.10120  ORF Transcript_8069/g.10120 Transcript_8069/m.10120 type:complete len:112 (+) Transcript_8069:92-427(+)